MKTRYALFPALLLAALFVAALTLTWFNLTTQLPRGEWRSGSPT